MPIPEGGIDFVRMRVYVYVYVLSVSEITHNYKRNDMQQTKMQSQIHARRDMQIKEACNKSVRNLIGLIFTHN